MKWILSLILVAQASLVHAGEFEWVIPDAAEASPPAASAPSVDSYVYQVRVHPRGREVPGGGGCAVSIGDGALQTVAHIFEGIPSPVCEVQIDGVWQPATFRIVNKAADADVALLRVRQKLHAPPRRAPKYLERVTVYGVKTGVLQCGFVSSEQTVSLDESETGTKSGDSGGGVFSEDGEFLGTVRGSTQFENRVVSFKPNDFAVITVASKPAARASGDKYDAIISQWYRGGAYWTHPDTITRHLVNEHGVTQSELAGMSNAKREQLHSALHERERSGNRAPRQAPTASCPSGNCPLQQRSYGKPRTGLFGGLFR